MEKEELAAAFLAALPPGRAADPATLGDELAARVDAGRAAWPALALDGAAFARHLASHAAPDLPPLKHAADLWLACACANGVAGAAAAFERAHRDILERAAARVSPSARDEIRQAVMVSLLVAEPGDRPRIAAYAGRATLRTWLATIAANAALNHAKRRDEQPHDSLAAIGEAAAGRDPDVALVKARHAKALDAALRDAVGALDARRRLALRLHHVQGWTVERVAAMQQMSRSAAGRMLVDARQTLLEETKRLLRERMKLTPSELESLVAAVQSDLDVSLVRLLDE